MSASMQPMWGSLVPAIPLCAEVVVMVKQGQGDGGANTGDGMAQAGAAIDAMAAFKSSLASYTVANFDHVSASETTSYISSNKLSLFGGLATLWCSGLGGDDYSRVVNDGISAGNGRFNTSQNSAGNWYEAVAEFTIELASYKNAFACFVTDLEDFGVNCTFNFYDGATLVKSLPMPTTPAAKPGASEAMAVCYGDGNIQFNKIIVSVIQQDPGDTTFWGGVGYDDLLVGSVLPCTPNISVCGEFYSFVRQGSGDGGPSVGEGIAQSGAAFTARAAFRASLLSFISADMEHITAAVTTNYTNALPITMWGGVGSITPFGLNGNALRVDNRSGNGRFNTSANATGRWIDSNRAFEITLTSPRTAFDFNTMDIGDFNAEVEVEFFLAGVKNRALILPVVSSEKPGPGFFMNVAYSNGNLPFDRLLINLTHPFGRPPSDGVGFDDLAIGHVMACTPGTTFTVHHAENDESVAAKTVAGPALTAHDSWALGVQNLSTSDFSGAALGVTASPVSVAFSGPLNSRVATVTALAYDFERAQSVGLVTVENSAISQRWGNGGRWLEFEDELHIAFNAAISEVGFYLTDLGDRNATIRISLTNAAGSGVVHYLPKASQLLAPSGRLRFWGVRGERPFTKVIIRPMYYTNLNPYLNVVDTGAAQNVWSADTSVTKDVIGIHSIFIGA